jgi:hypothetical protein
MSFGTGLIFNSSSTQTAKLNKCHKTTGFYPNFTPYLEVLSSYYSEQGTFAQIFATGSNFLPAAYGNTYVSFGDYGELPTTIYSSKNLSFYVPLNVEHGIYDVTIVNVYNSNFGPSVKWTQAGIPNISNILQYTIT